MAKSGRPKKKKVPVVIDEAQDDTEIIDDSNVNETVNTTDRFDDVMVDDYTMPEDIIQTKDNKDYVEMIHNKYSTDRSIYELQMDDILREIEITYRALHYDNEKGKYYRLKGSDPIMNDTGVNQILKILKSIIHKGTFMSSLDKPKVNQIVQSVGDSILYLISCNWKVWGIKGIDSAIMIYNELLVNLLTGLSRSINSDEKHYREKAMGYQVGVNGKLPGGSEANDMMFGGI